MSDADIASFYVHTVTAEPYLGAGANGAKYDDPVTFPAFVEQKRQIVRDANGEQVVSSTTVYCDPAYAANLAPKSRVTFAAGRKSIVIIRADHDSGDLDLPDHCEAALQ